MTSNSPKLHRTLPPGLLDCQTLGRMILIIDEVWWRIERPGDIIVLLKWWGENEPTEFYPCERTKNTNSNNPDTKKIYYLKCSPSNLESYFKEMESIDLKVIRAMSREQVGTVIIPNLASMLINYPHQNFYVIMDLHGNAIGDLHIAFKILYTSPKPNRGKNSSFFTPGTTYKKHNTLIHSNRVKQRETRATQTAELSAREVVKPEVNHQSQNIPPVRRARVLNDLMLRNVGPHGGGNVSYELGNHPPESTVPKTSLGDECVTAVEPINTYLSKKDKQKIKAASLFSYSNCIKVSCKILSLNDQGLRKVLAPHPTSTRRSVIPRKQSSLLSAPPKDDFMQLGATYFIEYEFPQNTNTTERCQRKKEIQPWASTVKRFCSNRQVGSCVYFYQWNVHLIQGHMSVEETLSSLVLEFKVYSRRLHQRLPTFIGRAQFKTSDLCQKRCLAITQSVPVIYTGELQSSPVHTGSLILKVEYGLDKIYFGSSFTRKLCLDRAKELADARLSCLQDQPEVKSTQVREVATSTKDLSKVRPNMLQQNILLLTLLHISLGRNFDMARLYLLAHMFWNDIVLSRVSYETEIQHFSMSELSHVLLSSKFLKRCQNNFLITEVRKKQRDGSSTLVGMAKLRLHKFYLSYKDEALVEKLLTAKYPVVALDGWVSVTNPISQDLMGEVKVLLALGTENQISLLQKELQTVGPFSESQKPKHAEVEDSDGIRVANMKKRDSLKKAALRSVLAEQTANAENRIAEEGKQAANFRPSYLQGKPLPKSNFGTTPNYKNLSESLNVREATSSDGYLNRKSCYENKCQTQPQTTSGVEVEQNSDNELPIPFARNQIHCKSQGFQTDITMVKDKGFGAISSMMSPKDLKNEKMFKQFKSTAVQTDIKSLYSIHSGDELRTLVLEPTSEGHNNTTGEYNLIPLNPNNEASESVLITQARGNESRLLQCEIDPRSTYILSANDNWVQSSIIRAHIEVERALHLNLVLPFGQDCTEYGFYVTFYSDETHTFLEYRVNPLHVSNIVFKEIDPIWKWHCDTVLPGILFIDQNKSLVFKVWQTDGRRKRPSPLRDRVLGCAVVDLSELVFGLPSISSWFNILDSTGQCNGQIKINVTPLENLSRLRSIIPVEICGEPSSSCQD